MPIQRQLVSLVLLLIFAVGCSTTPFKPGQPVQVEGSVWTRDYKQNNQSINRNSLLENMRSDPKAGEKASSSQTWQYVSLVPSVVGGVLIGYYAVSNQVNDDDRWIGILSGIGLAGIGIGLGIKAENLLSESVEIYNSNLPAPKKTLLLQPAVLATRTTPAFGVSGSWQIE